MDKLDNLKRTQSPTQSALGAESLSASHKFHSMAPTAELMAVFFFSTLCKVLPLQVYKIVFVILHF